jgi:tRNA pseudouridine38-40 synthase
MRYAFKIAYFGENFHGSQYQPDVRTVEGEILKALDKLGIKDPKLKCASRTDAGVHALGQVIVFNSEETIFPRILNSELPNDITAWAWAKVDDDFDPRHAKRRTYVYVMYGNDDFDISRMRKALKLVTGTHDFSNFTRKFGEGNSCVRTIYNAEIRADRGFIIFEFTANAFTWNMVRCLVSALVEIGKSHRNLEWFEDMLHPEKHRERIEPAPPHGLILKDVEYEDLEFEVDDYAFKTLNSRIGEIVEYYGVIYKLFSLFRQT